MTSSSFPGPAQIRRFTFAERLCHWVVGLTFVLLLMSGLALSYPSLFWLTVLLGGGQMSRALHPWIGALFTVAMVWMVAVWIRDMRLTDGDRDWLRKIMAYIRRDRANVPPAGKYNAGQKLFFWAQGLLAVLFVVSGVALWFPSAFGSSTLTAMRFVHYGATLTGGLLFIVHVYLGTVAYPGTLGAMLHGRVSAAWAGHHHPDWRPESTDT